MAWAQSMALLTGRSVLNGVPCTLGCGVALDARLLNEQPPVRGASRQRAQAVPGFDMKPEYLAW